MSETVILITVIASALLNPFLNYLVNSRCSKIKMCCIECDREVLDEHHDLQQSNKKNNDNNQL